MALSSLYEQQLFEQYVKGQTIVDIEEGFHFDFVLANDLRVSWYCSGTRVDYTDDVRFDYKYVFSISDAGQCEIACNNDESLNDNPNAADIFTGDDDDSEIWNRLEQMQALIGKKIVDASGGKNTLTLQFNDGSFLRSKFWTPFHYRYSSVER